MKNIIITSLLAAGVSSAAVVNIDFGRVDAGQESGAGWNNVSGTIGTQATNTTQILSMVDSGNATTTIDLNIAYTVPSGGLAAGGGGSDHDGTAPNFSYPAAVAGFADSAISDSFFIGGAPGAMTMTFSGLDSGSTYEFLIFGSRGNNGGDSQYSVVGANSDTVSISSVLDNSTEAPTTIAITPDGSDQIVVTWTAATQFGALNMMSITSTAVPEPSSFSLLGLAALGLLRRRRG